MSGALAFDAAWLFAGFLILVALLAAGLTLRRYLLERGGGTVECALRQPGGSWRLGVAAYRPDALRWYQVFGIQVRPNQVFNRRTLTVLSRRVAGPDEEATLGVGTIVIRCRVAGNEGGPVELAISEEALTGLLAWLEAAPPAPGSYLGRAS